MANTKVTTGVIKDDAVGADQLASNAVVTASIADNAVTTAKISDDAILTAKISNSAITNAKMSANSVDSDQYVDGSIDTAHIADSQITSAKLDTNIAVSGTLTLGSHLIMGDGDILKMGASADLQIYHDGSASIITDVGTGDLRLLGNNLKLGKSDNSATYLYATEDGSVELYYAGAKKLETASSGVTVTGVITTDGLTTSADINFGDNDKAVFGAGSDLQIYHDGSNSIISDEGTGGIKIFTAGVATSGFYKIGGEELATFEPDGPVTLYHNDVAKLATTSTGIKIGAGGHPVDTDADDIVVMNTSGASGITISAQNNSVSSLRFGDSDLARSGMFYYNHNDNYLRIDTSGTERMRIDSSGTIKSSVNGSNANLILDNDADTPYLRFDESSASKFTIGEGSVVGGASGDGFYDFYAVAGIGQRFFTNAAERMRITSAGLVGIGTSGPVSQMHLSTSTAQDDAHGQLKVVQTDTSGGASTNAGINVMNHYGTSQFMQWEDNGLRIGSRILTNSGNGNVILTTGADAEAMRLLANGNVGINDSSPDRTLHVNSGGTNVVAKFESTDQTAAIEFTDNAGSAEIGGVGNDVVFFPAGAEKARITSAGLLGIGTTSPSAPLDVVTDSVVYAAEFTQQKTSNGDGVFIQVGSTASADYALTVRSDAGNTSCLAVKADKKVGIGTFLPDAMLHLEGGNEEAKIKFSVGTGNADKFKIYASSSGRLYVNSYSGNTGVYLNYNGTSWTSNSDETLKDNISSLGTVGDKLKNYRTSYFTWKADTETPPKRNIGFIAQDWETDFPEVVTKKEGETLGMQYTETIPILLKYIQELEARITALEA